MFIIIEYIASEIMGCVRDNEEILRFDTNNEAVKWAKENLAFNWSVVELT